MSEERTSTYINTYILPKGLDYSLFIFPHSFNGYFLDVVFLELQHHMNKSSHRNRKHRNMGKNYQNGKLSWSTFYSQKAKRTNLWQKMINEKDYCFLQASFNKSPEWSLFNEPYLQNIKKRDTVQLQTRTTR